MTLDYEHLQLHPSNGRIDRDAITSWLGSKDFAYLDPIENKVWHLSADQEQKEHSLAARRADPTQFTPGVTVLLFPDHVSVNAYTALNAEPRALELLQWLASEGEWTVQRDQAPAEPLGDPARLFPVGTGEPDYLIGDVVEGVRHTWEANGRVFTTHSGGQWKLVDTGASWRGELSPSARDQWKNAIAAARQSGELVDFVDPDTATGNLDAEDPDGLERSYFNAADIPAPLRPAATLVDRWSAELASWNGSSTSTDLLRVRED